MFKPKPDLSSEEQKRILVHPDWPKRPYNVIAQSLGLATCIYRKSIQVQPAQNQKIISEKVVTEFLEWTKKHAEIAQGSKESWAETLLGPIADKLIGMSRNSPF